MTTVAINGKTNYTFGFPGESGVFHYNTHLSLIVYLGLEERDTGESNRKPGPFGDLSSTQVRAFRLTFRLQLPRGKERDRDRESEIDREGARGRETWRERDREG